MRRLWRLMLLAPLAGCGGAGGGCGPAEARLENASTQAVEQVYLTPAGAAGWGADLLRGAPDLPPGGALPLRFQVPGRHALRVVWTNGRASELAGIEGCAARRITLRDDSLRAE